jgi:hypothetical protein
VRPCHTGCEWHTPELVANFSHASSRSTAIPFGLPGWAVWTLRRRPARGQSHDGGSGRTRGDVGDVAYVAGSGVGTAWPVFDHHDMAVALANDPAGLGAGALLRLVNDLRRHGRPRRVVRAVSDVNVDLGLVRRCASSFRCQPLSAKNIFRNRAIAGNARQHLSRTAAGACLGVYPDLSLPKKGGVQCVCSLRCWDSCWL